MPCSRSSSQKVQVTATLGSATSNLVIWVIWANVTPKFSGSMDSDDPLDFPSWCPGNTLGPWNDIGSPPPPALVGNKVEMVGQLTPSGIGDLIESGWNFSQDVATRTWTSTTSYVDGASGPDAWDPNFENDFPVGDDKIFLIDFPSSGSSSGTSILRAEWNFKTRVKWGGQVISDDALWYARVKAEPNGGSYTSYTCTAGSGNPDFSTTY